VSEHVSREKYKGAIAMARGTPKRSEYSPVATMFKKKMQPDKGFVEDRCERQKAKKKEKLSRAID